jgi:hypothetical protein
MKIAWVTASGYQFDPSVSLEQIKSVGPIWGSWQTWRGCNTDNVICNNQRKSRELLDRAFQAVCNFYVPRSLYEPLARPVGVKFYDGEFSSEVDDIEDIISLHLAASQSDIVLMLGFTWTLPKDIEDRLERHKLANRHGLMRGAIDGMPNVQWVAVDSGEMDKSYQSLSNLTSDSLPNVLQLLV